jgi:hypothetical protein
MAGNPLVITACSTGCPRWPHVSSATHDNNALQVISGTVELLLGSPNLPEGMAQALGRIARSQARRSHCRGDGATRSTTDAMGPVDLRAVVLRAVALRRYRREPV